MRHSVVSSRAVLGFGLVSLFGLSLATDAKAKQRPGQLSKQTVLAGQFPSRISFKLMAAMKLAASRLVERPACADLFLPLTDDPLQALYLTSYHLAGVGAETRACEAKGVVAYTTVGGHRTHLCPPLFERLNNRQAAVVLLHEALHRAGLTEWPPDPNGLTSAEINSMVIRGCNL